MNVAPQAREYLKDDFGGDQRMLVACERILSFIEAHSAEELKYLSYANLLGAAQVDTETFFAAVRYLTGARCEVLEPKFEFIDADTGQIEDVEAADLADARKTGTFYHPSKGSPVDGFEDKVFMYFIPGPLVTG